MNLVPLIELSKSIDSSKASSDFEVNTLFTSYLMANSYGKISKQYHILKKIHLRELLQSNILSLRQCCRYNSLRISNPIMGEKQQKYVVLISAIDQHRQGKHYLDKVLSYITK